MTGEPAAGHSGTASTRTQRSAKLRYSGDHGMPSGQTIEVINTDAEGRLVLCDAITWVQKEFHSQNLRESLV